MPHTEGPWIVFEDGDAECRQFTILPAGRPGEIAQVNTSADADLIRAAPDLLAALQGCVATCDNDFTAIKKARALIASIVKPIVVPTLGS